MSENINANSKIDEFYKLSESYLKNKNNKNYKQEEKKIIDCFLQIEDLGDFSASTKAKLLTQWISIVAKMCEARMLNYPNEKKTISKDDFCAFFETGDPEKIFNKFSNEYTMKSKFHEYFTFFTGEPVWPKELHDAMNTLSRGFNSYTDVKKELENPSEFRGFEDADPKSERVKYDYSHVGGYTAKKQLHDWEVNTLESLINTSKQEKNEKLLFEFLARLYKFQNAYNIKTDCVTYTGPMTDLQWALSYYDFVTHGKHSSDIDFENRTQNSNFYNVGVSSVWRRPRGLKENFKTWVKELNSVIEGRMWSKTGLGRDNANDPSYIRTKDRLDKKTTEITKDGGILDSVELGAIPLPTLIKEMLTGKTSGNSELKNHSQTEKKPLITKKSLSYKSKKSKTVKSKNTENQERHPLPFFSDLCGWLKRKIKS